MRSRFKKKKETIKKNCGFCAALIVDCVACLFCHFPQTDDPGSLESPQPAADLFFRADEAAARYCSGNKASPAAPEPFGRHRAERSMNPTSGL